ncbi:MAG: hypothetical protein BGO43_07675 [Gammaproteobacteria bacterium 39-13]|nr:MBL fold metallo-hydrolase [Gammaproteobacteria bacterium]OJV93046.1 MAG: hypothetical protein BGO43_07675 [Gammaproteobacteria bacterium 39-13]
MKKPFDSYLEHVVKPENQSCFDGKRFYNLWHHQIPSKGRAALLKWKLTQKKNFWPKHIANTEIPQLPDNIETDELYITFINHSTELIQVQGLNVLTDPLFSKRTSPVSWLGPKRVRAPGMILKNLPPIDVVIISHNHYDHMDLPSLRALKHKDDPLFIVPLQNAYILNKVGITKIIELDWWQEHVINESNTIMAVPMQHWSQRTFSDINKSLWSGFSLTLGEIKILFAGDTGYGQHFKLIRDKIGKMDVSLLPIGAYEPRWFMKGSHLNPEEAVKAHIDLESTLSIGMHFGTFQLSDEGYDDPVIHLQEALKKHQICEEYFLAPTNGRTTYYKKN